MTTRRDFIRRGALWVAGAAVVEPVARKLWAFPTNPLGRVDEGGYRVVAHDTVQLTPEQWKAWIEAQIAEDMRLITKAHYEQMMREVWSEFHNGDSPIRNPRGVLS